MRYLIVVLMVFVSFTDARAQWVKTKNNGGWSKSYAICTQTPDSSGNSYCIARPADFNPISSTGAIAKVSASGTAITTDNGPTCLATSHWMYTAIGVYNDVVYVGCGDRYSQSAGTRYSSCSTSAFGSCSWTNSPTLGAGQNCGWGCGDYGPFDGYGGAASVAHVPVYPGVYNYAWLYDGATYKNATNQVGNVVLPICGLVGSYRVCTWAGPSTWNYRESWNSSFVYAGGSEGRLYYEYSGIYGNLAINQTAVVSSSQMIACYSADYGGSSLVVGTAGNLVRRDTFTGHNMLCGIYGSELTGNTRFSVLNELGACYTYSADPIASGSTLSATAACDVTLDGGDSVISMFRLGSPAKPAVLTSGGDVFVWGAVLSSGSPKLRPRSPVAQAQAPLSVIP